MATVTDKITYEFNKNSREIVRAGHTEYQGHKLVYLRVFYNAGSDEKPEWRPTRKGITISEELLNEVIKAVNSLKGEDA
jgi:hypothetical protein